MGILSGALGARRFRVAGKLQDNFRDLYGEHLTKLGFRPPPSLSPNADVEGWVLIDDLTTSRFDDINKWLVDHYLVFSMRIDTLRLPAKIVKAEVRRRCQEWTEEHNVERCPAQVRSEIKSSVEEEMAQRSMPATKIVEIAWDIHSDMLYVSSASETICDRLRRRFYRTFGRRLVPFSPLDWVDEKLATKAVTTSTLEAVESVVSDIAASTRNITAAPEGEVEQEGGNDE
jgi:recombination associated protein RdgC